MDEEEGKGVISVRPISRMRWDERQEHPVQGDAKGVHHPRDAFQANNVYGASATGYAYGHALSSSYSSTGSVESSPGYGIGSYGARRGGVAMKREEDEMSVSFSFREEDEEEEEGGGGSGRSEERSEERVVEREEVGWNGDGGGYGYGFFFFSRTNRI